MKKLFKYIFLVVFSIIFISNKVYAKVSNYDEAWEYVTNKENGFCGYKTDNLVVGIKTKGISKGYDTYVYHKTSGLITEKKVFSSQSYEKGKCPKYAQVQLGYVGESAVYGIMISDRTTTLGNNTGDWKPATQGYTFNSGVIGVQFDSSQEDGIPNTNPSPEVLEAFEKRKSEYEKKYNCLYVDDINRIIFGNNGGKSSGSLYIGYETIYEIKLIGKLDDEKCANYAKIVKGTNDDKEVVKVFLSEDQKSLTSLTTKKMGVQNIILASNILSSSKIYDIEPPELNTDLPDDIDNCQSLLGNPDIPGSPASYIVIAFDVIKYVALVLMIVLSVMDFTGAIAKQDKDAMAKVLKKLMLRFILCIIIFLLPWLVKLLLKYFVERQTDLCGM